MSSPEPLRCTDVPIAQEAVTKAASGGSRTARIAPTLSMKSRSSGDDGLVLPCERLEEVRQLRGDLRDHVVDGLLKLKTHHWSFCADGPKR